MLRHENALAAKHLADSLRTTITTSAECLEDLKQSFRHRSVDNLAEARTFSRNLRKDIDQLQADITPIQPLMKAPPACDLLDAGLGQVDVVDKILGMFEQRLQEAYGIEVKVNEELELDGDDVPSKDVRSTAGATSMTTTHTPEKTPKGRTSPQFEEVLPATPKLEDFGISSADLEALAAAPTQQLPVASTPTYQHGMSPRVKIGSGDYGEAVAKSMTALGIETPVQVADKFSARRHIALRGVMPGTTPRMTAGKGKMLDYTGLAGGYYERRQLDFDDDDGIKGKYERAGGFWKDSCPLEVIVKAADVAREVRGGLRQDEIVELLEERLDGIDGLAVLVGLTKMKVLSVSKENGDAIYRYGG